MRADYLITRLLTSCFLSGLYLVSGDMMLIMFRASMLALGSLAPELVMSLVTIINNRLLSNNSYQLIR